MIRRLLSLISPDITPTAAESIAKAVEAASAADGVLAAAVEWTLPPMQPTTEAEEATLRRLRAYILTARSALQEVTP